MNNTLFPVVILAGGLATRLHPLTEQFPKSLISIHGEPFIVHQLRLLRKNHIQRVVICVGFLGEQIAEFVGDGSQFGLNVTYVYDGPTLLGTGGAIKHALPFLGSHFFILYGDSYLPCDFQAVQTAFIKSQQMALMTVFQNKGIWDVSNIEFQNKQILVYDKKNRTAKMHYIDYGLGVITAHAFDAVPPNTPYDLADLYQLLLNKQQLVAHEIHERFYEIGSFAGIKELEYYLTQQEIRNT